MKSATPPPASVEDEIAALIASLHQTGARLEVLTAGEVDSVVDRSGRTLLLRGVQDQLRHAEDSRQAAVLNALPANIALLDTRGTILSVNAAWEKFGAANALHWPGHAVGANYLAICDAAAGENAAEAGSAAKGIRAVLSGGKPSYALEYPCHSPVEKRWFLMTVTPLPGEPPNGAVVMHLNITERQEAQNKFLASELLLDNIVENIPTAVQVKSVQDGLRIQLWNKAAEAMYSLPRQDAIGRHVRDLWPPADAERMHAADLDLLARGGAQDFPDRIAQTRDRGDIRVHMRKVVLTDADGKATHLLVAADDITARKAAEERIIRLNRVYAVLSGINSAIVRIRERGELFAEVCQLAVSAGEFVIARVISLDADGKAAVAASTEPVTPVFQKILDEYNGDPLRSGTLLGLAMRSGEPVIANDVAHDPRMPNRAALTKDGNFSVAILPFLSGPRLAGAIILRSRAAGTFNDDEIRLLRELVANISLALEHIEQAEQITAIGEEQKQALLALRESERRFSDILGNVELISMMVDGEARITYCNDYLLRLTGWRFEEIIGRDWGDIFIPPDVEGVEARFAAILAGKPGTRHRENEILTRSGTRLLVRWNNTVLRSSAGDVIGWASIGEDITERKVDEIRIRRLNRVYAVLSGINSLIVRVKDRDELFKGACRIAVEDGGFVLAWVGIIDRGTMMLEPVASAGATQDHLTLINQRFSLGIDAPLGNTFSARAIREKRIVVSNDVQNDPAALFREEHVRRGSRSMAMLPLQVGDEVAGILALYSGEPGFFDDEELKLLAELAGDVAFAINHLGKQEQIDYLAYYDELTGLANRRLFLERVAQYLRSAAISGHGMAVFLIDLERFKNINDSLGRTAGDALLKQVAEWLTHNIGDASLLARLGADQFAVVLPVLKPEGSMAHLIEKTMAAFMLHPFRLDESLLRVSVKLGAAVFPDDGADAYTLLRNAEAALKRAKRGGERYLLYVEGMTDQAAGKLTLENQLREALDNGEFVLHYQPKTSLESGKVTGVEALIRWNDPRTGLVPPGKFIPVLEETGLISEVGRWALRQALQDYLRWRDAGLPAVRISVNVSPMQLRNRGFIAEIEQILSVDPQAAAGLELEITESLIMADVKHSIASLKAIRALGVTVAIDDFGTGFSSLSYLAKLPVDTLKIDRSFITDMTVGPEGLSLVSMIIDLAHSLRLSVVAEGVETDEQSRLLRLLKCDEMQGFLFSKPLPAGELESRFLARPTGP